MKMMELPYKLDAFKNFSEATMKNHYEILYKGYVDNYNKTLEGLEKARLEKDYTNIKALEKNLAFQGAGASLHNLFFENITPNEVKISDELKLKLEKDFGSFEDFKDHFINNMINIEGGGWGLLGYSKMLGKMIILQAEKHQDHTVWDFIPLLAIDMWEHSYYLDYFTNKKEYALNMFDAINWEVVEKRLNKEL